MGNSWWKYAPKAIPRPLFILMNNPKQPLHARNSFKNKDILKVDYVKAFFETSPGKFIYNIPLLVKCYLTKFDDVI